MIQTSYCLQLSLALYRNNGERMEHPLWRPNWLFIIACQNRPTAHGQTEKLWLNPQCMAIPWDKVLTGFWELKLLLTPNRGWAPPADQRGRTQGCVGSEQYLEITPYTWQTRTVKCLLSELYTYIRLREVAQSRLFIWYLSFLERWVFQSLLSFVALVQRKAMGILSWLPKQGGSLWCRTCK